MKSWWSLGFEEQARDPGGGGQKAEPLGRALRTVLVGSKGWLRDNQETFLSFLVLEGKVAGPDQQAGPSDNARHRCSVYISGNLQAPRWAPAGRWVRNAMKGLRQRGP